MKNSTTNDLCILITSVYLEIPNWSPEMHVNWSLCMKLYISAPRDMDEAARMFIEVCKQQDKNCYLSLINQSKDKTLNLLQCKSTYVHTDDRTVGSALVATCITFYSVKIWWGFKFDCINIYYHVLIYKSSTISVNPNL